jgi:hypothetical protein
MDDTQEKVEVVVGEEVEPEKQIVVGKDGKSVVLEENAYGGKRFAPGVYQGRGFKEHPENINKKGRPKGINWAAVQEKIFDERTAGVSDEEFMAEQIKKAHAGDKNSLKFVSQFMRKPPKEEEKTIEHRFILPNTLPRKLLPELDTGNESDEEYNG